MTKSSTKKNSPVASPKSDRVTKKDQLIKLLRTKAGADVAAISAKLGWQQHTTRAALTGLRKAGFEVAGEKPAKGGASKYRILSGPGAVTPKPKQATTSEAGRAG